MSRYIKKQASLSHLRVFDCLCHATNTVKEDKFAERARQAIFMGYSETQKGYVQLNLNSQQFFVSRDVIFHEIVFPFATQPHAYHTSPIDYLQMPSLEPSQSSQLSPDPAIATSTDDDTSLTFDDETYGFSELENERGAEVEMMPELEIPESSAHHSPTLRKFTRDSKQLAWCMYERLRHHTNH